ncbi:MULTISPECIES: cupin domain-containing protein [Phyllobacteriaceae]|jgi:quercetin dioxygenase-like cupin family protein|uniref:cupin domain-containing protein n=1 Tax=Phyllobacteriaceae TaxID=69277 RepID=UPI000467AC53|nr:MULTISPECIES: cupin domain-containing protein [Mesorhizobium]MBN9232545.1 cupin domain-containing protein [Mesorhizobium sp.]MDQ0330142.1 quercetin dioxygenase-like cupin family protein [Mesorhizobium sp. YL-MeA3-2017]
MSSQGFEAEIFSGRRKRYYLGGLTAAAAIGASIAGFHALATSPRPATIHMAESASPVSASGRPVTEIKPISCTPLPDITGKAVTMAIVNFPPDAYTPRHRHPGNVTAFVLKGTLKSQLAGEPPMTYTEGQSWFEPTGAIHLYAENASKTEPASLLAMFIADENCGPLTIPMPDGHDGHAS